MKPVVVMTQTSYQHSDEISIIHKPFIDIKPLAINESLLQLNYDWIIFSSKNAVKQFLPYLSQVKTKYIAAIGKKTADYCKQSGIAVDFTPSDFSQEGFLAEFNYQHQRILIPSSAQARALLAEQLSQYNEVTKIDLYQPVAHQKHISEVKTLIQNNKIDALTFSSSSAVRYYFNDGNIPEFNHYFAIGKQTAQTIKQFNQPVVVSDIQTTQSLIDKILESRDNHAI